MNTYPKWFNISCVITLLLVPAGFLFGFFINSDIGFTLMTVGFLYISLLGNTAEEIRLNYCKKEEDDT